MSGNPLSERSELWISANTLSSFCQALEFRSASTENPEGSSGLGIRLDLTLTAYRKISK